MIIAFAVTSIEIFGIDRRRDQFGGDFSYFLYPVASTVPGIGTASGLGFSVLNMFETNTDFTGFSLEGDFDASGYVLLDIHLLPELLVFDVGRYDFRVAPLSYDRGIDSDPEDYYMVEVEGENFIGQTTLTFGERMLEIYYRYGAGKDRLISLMDKDGRKFENIGGDWEDGAQSSIGAVVDWTDDRLDPRLGLRLEYVRKTAKDENVMNSKFHVDDRNFHVYIPLGISTFVLNYYQSDAVVYDKATTNREEIKSGLDIACDPLSPSYQQCSDTLEKSIDSIVARNSYGIASSLGGTQRLRSYPGGRFFAGHSVFWGAEMRWNLSDVTEPFNIFIAKGVRTGFQLAFFAEQGSVNDDPAKLFEDMRASYGLGFRILLSGVVLRMDWSTGDEGSVTQMFMGYSWGLFSVDNPG